MAQAQAFFRPSAEHVPRQHGLQAPGTNPYACMSEPGTFPASTPAMSTAGSFAQAVLADMTLPAGW